MKLKTTLLAVSLAAFAASSVYANEEHHTDAKAETPKVEKAEGNKPMKKHNHMEEKTGIAMPEAKAHSETSAEQPPVKRHYHPTDR